RGTGRSSTSSSRSSSSTGGGGTLRLRTTAGLSSFRSSSSTGGAGALRGRATTAFEAGGEPFSPGTGKAAVHFGHLIFFPTGKVSAIRRWTPQDGQASFFVSIVDHLRFMGSGTACASHAILCSRSGTTAATKKLLFLPPEPAP